MRRWTILPLCMLLFAGCNQIPVTDLEANTYEVYSSPQSFQDVRGRLQRLVGEQRWLAWVSRSSGCVESPDSDDKRYLVLCGKMSLWKDRNNHRDPWDPYTRIVIALPDETGSKVHITKPHKMIFGFDHPNTEIFDRAGIKAEFVRMRKPGRRGHD